MSVYEQIVGYLDEARAAECQEEAHRAYADAQTLVAEHRTTVRHNTVRTGELHELLGLDWVDVYDPVAGRFASVHWSDIDGEVPA